MEEELVERLRRGDAAAFRELLEQHGKSFHQMALRVTRDEAEAEDAVQDGLVLLLRRIDTFRHESSFSTWMHRVVINAALMRRRRAHRRHETGELPVEEQAVETPPADEQLAREQLRISTRSMISDLPETHREVLWLRHVRGLSTSATAELLGVSDGAAKVRLHRARAAFARLADQSESVQAE